MQTQISNLILASSAFLMLFGIAELLYRFVGTKAEHTRKIVHAGSGILALAFPFLFEDFFFVVGLCSSFLGILFLSKKMNFLPSVHAVERKTSGAFWFPAVVAACFASSQYFGDNAFFYLPILTLALADPAACLVGQKMPLKKINLTGSKKSIGGAFGFFAVAFAIAAIGMNFNFQNNFWAWAAFAAATTLAELIGSKGSDNLTIPLASTAVLAAFYSPIIFA